LDATKRSLYRSKISGIGGHDFILIGREALVQPLSSHLSNFVSTGSSQKAAVVRFSTWHKIR
jgi:hypothetical protein